MLATVPKALQLVLRFGFPVQLDERAFISLLGKYFCESWAHIVLLAHLDLGSSSPSGLFLHNLFSTVCSGLRGDRSASVGLPVSMLSQEAVQPKRSGIVTS